MITRAHVIAWRDDLMRPKNDTGDPLIEDATIRRKLSALSSLFNHLCDCNAVTHNPVKGVKRPLAHTNEGSTPALSDAQALALLEAPPEDTVKGKRDRAILAVLLFGALRRQELCDLRVKDYQMRSGVRVLRVKGKGRKVRFVEAEATTQRLLVDYLDLAGHTDDLDGPLFRPVRNRVSGELRKHLHPTSVYP